MRTLSIEEGVEGLIERAAGARFVLLGEASHGTHEFYALRAEVTKRLIDERGFSAVAVEADWPDAYRVHCYVRGVGGDANADEALAGFRRFPTWMWRNGVVLDFVDWLRDRNERSGRDDGFYGLDLYSLHASIAAVVQYLDQTDPQAAQRARERFACFEHFHAEHDGQSYGLATAVGNAEPCEADVVAQLVELRARAGELTARDGNLAEDRQFAAEQNARVIVNAERYYRAMFRGRASSWNLRDTHMADMLDALADHLDGGRIVVWAHNSHLGDARATEMSRRGELNLGQLVRERHPGDGLLVGFSTYEGTVTAASDWGAPAERKRVRPGLPGSWEARFHEAGRDFAVVADQPALHDRRPQRAIGVIYRPETERQSHYFEASPAGQFDLLFHLDQTRALEPIERENSWDEREVPETYPSAL
jgi:erythromycin esterase-like protein